MTLEEKGQILPPPVLSTYPQRVSEEIQKWENIIAATHWDLYDPTRVDGADFYVRDEELGHIHIDGSIHLPTNAALKTALLNKNLAKNFPYGSRDEHWIQFKIVAEQDVERAIFLFQLNYERLRGTETEILLSKVNSL